MATNRLKKHQKAILAVLHSHEYADAKVQSVCLADMQKHHYQLVLLGLDKNNASYIWIRVHIQLKEDGKIWILENRTEYEIDTELEAEGIKKVDIVLGLLPEHVRKYSAYGN